MLKRKSSSKGGKGGNKRRKTSYLGASSPWFTSGGSSSYGLRGRPSQVRVPGNIGVAGRAFVKLKTTYTASFTSTSGAFTTFRIAKLNSVFDPTGTLTSITAVGSTQWNAQYHSYVVHGFALKLTFPSASSQVSGFMLGAHPCANLQTAPSNFYEAAGQPFAKTMVQGEGTSSTPRSIRWPYMSIGQVIGQPKQTIAYDATFAAQVTADPATLVVMQVWMQALDLASTAFCEGIIEITQYVEYFGPKLVTSA